MTEKIFWQDPYQTSRKTYVATVDGAEVTLRETIFYALSGGQESDAGTIGGRPVIEARKAGREIFYRLDPDHGLQPDDPVEVQIDWERRYRLMRLHFAAEVILELVYQKFGAVEKIGAHIAADKARIDFLWPDNIAPELPALSQAAETIIAADQEIISAFSDAANEKRYWKIDEFSEVPCDGTHLKRTGEIRGIDLKRKNIGKGKERIEIFVP